MFAEPPVVERAEEEDAKIRAGIIKVAAGKTPFTEWEQSAFRAAAKVQKKTRTPIATHAIFEPRAQFDLLVKTGADPKRCFFSHIEAEFGWEGRSLSQEAKYLEAICKEGASLFFNNYLFEFDTPAPFFVRATMQTGRLRSSTG